MLPLKRPIILAPMAGGPSTPALCAAVTDAGGLGILAAGYLSTEQFQQAVAEVEQLTSGAYGINLFSMPCRQSLSGQDLKDWQAYRALLEQDPKVNVELPAKGNRTDDFYFDKLQIAADSAAKVLFFTFGYPDPAVIRELQARGKRVVLNATTPEEIDYLATSPCDAICVQGKEAGGHRATVLSSASDGAAHGAFELLAHARSITDKAIILAGGIGSAEDVARAIKAGACAVSVGTAFLLADEAGTKKTHRAALESLRGRPTCLTTAFSGRLARAIENGFIGQYGKVAPSLYPEVNYLTAPIRAAADQAGDPEYLNLWAGEGYERCQSGPAAGIVEQLASLL